MKMLGDEEFHAAFMAEAEASGRRPLLWDQWTLVGTEEESGLASIQGTGRLYQMWNLANGMVMVEYSPSGSYPYASFRWVMGEYKYSDALRAIADEEERLEWLSG